MIKKIKALLSNEYNKEELKKDLFCVFITIVSTFVYCLGVMWFLEPADLYSGGVTGIAQLINNLIIFSFNYNKLNLGVLVLIINIPILIYGWNGVSKRFVVCSILSILLQTLFMSGILPKVNLGINAGVNPLTGSTYISGTVGEMDILMLAMIGGFISGLGSSLALRYGSSTGGVDVLAQAVSFKKHISIGYMSLFVNIIVATLGAILAQNPAILFYTIVRIVVQSVVTDKVHTSYNNLKVEIITTKGDEIAELLIKKIGRGLTIFQGIGAYTHSEKTMLETVISSYEAHRVISLARSVDDKAFVSVSPIKMVVGNFKRKTIA